MRASDVGGQVDVVIGGESEGGSIATFRVDGGCAPDRLRMDEGAATYCRWKVYGASTPASPEQSNVTDLPSALIA